MSDSLTFRNCKCGSQAEEVIKVIDEHGVIIRPLRVAWYCHNCKTVEKTIGRERAVSWGR